MTATPAPGVYGPDQTAQPTTPSSSTTRLVVTDGEGFVRDLDEVLAHVRDETWHRDQWPCVDCPRAVSLRTGSALPSEPDEDGLNSRVPSSWSTRDLLFEYSDLQDDDRVDIAARLTALRDAFGGPLHRQVAGVRERIKVMRAKHGRVHLMAAHDNPIVEAGVTGIDGVPIHVESGVVLVDFSGAGTPDVAVAGSLLMIEAECMHSDEAGRCSEDPQHGEPS